MTSKPILIANWKANPRTLREALALAKKIELAASKQRRVEVVIAPPFPFLSAVGLALKRAKIGSQDAFWKDTGPYTGEVSWHQLKEIGVRYVIVGHSERRIFLGESDEMINKKTRVLLEQGLTPILCVGERERRDNEMSETIAHELTRALITQDMRPQDRAMLNYLRANYAKFQEGANNERGDENSGVSLQDLQFYAGLV